MASRKEFDLKLNYGQIHEGTVAALLTSLKVEVKADNRFSTTGNVCVEYAQNGPGRKKVPSGIAVTTAEWYCFRFIDDTCLIVPTEKLKQIAREMKQDPRNRRLTGDNGNISILIPIRRLLPLESLKLVGTQ